MPNRRTQVRVEVDLLVRFSDEKGMFVEECVGNVSKGGIFIETLKPRPMGEVIEVFLKIPKTDDEIAIQGEVVHVVNHTADADDSTDDSAMGLEEYRSRLGMGLRFLLVEPKQKDDLRRYIENLLEARGPGTREHTRFFKEKPLAVKFKNASDFRNLYMQNISRGGLFFETTEDLTLFDHLDLNFFSEALGKEIQLTCEVVHIRTPIKENAEKSKGIGVRFVDLDDAKQKEIDDFIREIIS